MVKALNPLVRCAFGNVFIFAGDSKEVSNPPHLTSGWSSAFIPFCAYKTDLNFSKVSPVLEGTDFPICSSFLPTILEGQLCYKLQLNQSSGQGKGNELMLLMDYNEDRSLPVSFEKSNDVKSFSTSALHLVMSEKLQEKSTLTPYPPLMFLEVETS